jgi:hypothetical protein
MISHHTTHQPKFNISCDYKDHNLINCLNQYAGLTIKQDIHQTINDVVSINPSNLIQDNTDYQSQRRLQCRILAFQMLALAFKLVDVFRLGLRKFFNTLYELGDARFQ